MAIESTAINDLVSGLQRQPLPRGHQDDWLFGEPDQMFVEPPRPDATQIDPNHPTTPFDKATPAAVPALSYPRADFGGRRNSPTTHIRTTNWPGIAKKLALPISVFSILIVLLGVYFAKADESKAAPAANVATKVVAPAPAPLPAAAPAATADPDPVAVPAAAADPVPAPAPVTDPVPAAAPAPAPAPAADPAPVAEPVITATVTAIEEPTAAPPAAAPTPTEPDVLIEPGTPASRFLPAAATQPTVPTVAPKAAPAPQTVANLPAPSASKAAASATAVAPAKTVAKPAKKSAAAKRSTRPIAAPKARSQKKVAAAREADDDAAPAKKGKGVLSIASTPSMQVWVDGRNSNAQTPVKIILLAGKHQVTLLDKQTSKAKSFEVVIKPDATTKIVKSY